MIDDITEPPKQNPIWRVISPQEDSIDEIDDVKPAGPVVWQSDFQVSHRINQNFQMGNIFFAGDAALQAVEYMGKSVAAAFEAQDGGTLVRLAEAVTVATYTSCVE